MNQETLGPIACWCWASLFNWGGVAGPSKKIARYELDSFRAERCWADVLVMCPEGSEGRRLLEEIGRAWREGEFGIPAAASDLRAAELGALRLFEGVLGKSLREELEELAK